MESRADALFAGIRIEVVTLLWMVLEATVAIASGIAASSILLIAFGLDSVIELISAGVLLWRLSAERGSPNHAEIERVEHRATWISAVLLVLLCAYVLITTGLGVLTRTQPETTPNGVLISVGALVFMPLLAHFKRSVNAQLNSAALRADIAESITCAYMAGTVLVGLLLNALLGWWWAEYAAALVLLYWLVRETREAFEAARGEGDEA